MKAHKVFLMGLLLWQLILTACSSDNDPEKPIEPPSSNEPNCAADGVHCKQYNSEL